MGRYTVHLVGEANYQPAVARLSPGDPVRLLPEPENAFDPRAVRAAGIDDATIGYLERDGWLTRAVLDDGTAAVAFVKHIIGGEGDKPMRGVVLDVRTAADADPGGPLAESAPLMQAQPQRFGSSGLTAEQMVLIEQRVANDGPSTGVAYALWFFLFLVSGHRFYLGRPGSAILQIISYFVLIGFFWALIDAFLIPGMVRDQQRQIRERFTVALASPA